MTTFLWKRAFLGVTFPFNDAALPCRGWHHRRCEHTHVFEERDWKKWAGKRSRVENGRHSHWSFSGTVNSVRSRRRSLKLRVWELTESAPILLWAVLCPTDNHRIRTSTSPTVGRTWYRVSVRSGNQWNQGGKGARFDRIGVSFSRLTREGEGASRLNTQASLGHIIILSWT